jgi:hypothetical protein
LAEHWKTKLSGCALRWNLIYKRWEVVVSSNLFEFCTIDLIYNFKKRDDTQWNIIAETENNIKIRQRKKKLLVRRAIR